MAADEKVNATGISAAALEGARQGEQEQQTDQSDNAEALAKPAPGMTDPRTDRTPTGSTESTVRMSEIAGDQVPEDDNPEWQRAGGASNPDAGANSGKPARD